MFSPKIFILQILIGAIGSHLFVLLVESFLLTLLKRRLNIQIFFELVLIVVGVHVLALLVISTDNVGYAVGLLVGTLLASEMQTIYFGKRIGRK